MKEGAGGAAAQMDSSFGVPPHKKYITGDRFVENMCFYVNKI